MRRFAVFLRSTATLALLAMPVVAFAQEPAPTPVNAPATSGAPADTLGDIVVTAQRRSQNLQNVPIAITAFSGQDLAAKQIQSTIDIPRLVPNMVGATNVGIGSANSYFIRGLGNTESIATFDPAVATYVDDIYLSRQNANNFAFFDVNRIEVLRGPQGTLFGRNTTFCRPIVRTAMQGYLTMTAPTYADLAQRLRNAYVNGAVPPLRDGLDPIDVAGAYAVQEINTRLWQAQGRRIVGRKAGLTAKAVQTQLGVDQPDFGVLFDDMQVADAGVLDPAHALQPKAEAEIAFVLGADLPHADTTPEQVAAAVASVHAAIEIVDSRIADWKITFADTVADNGSSAFFVLADAGKPLTGLDIWTAGMVMQINGQIVSLGVGAAALGHPLNAAAWLAQTLAARGEPLKTGDILLAGALGPMVALNPGDHVVAYVGGIGQVSFTYGEG